MWPTGKLSFQPQPARWITTDAAPTNPRVASSIRCSVIRAVSSDRSAPTVGSPRMLAINRWIRLMDLYPAPRQPQLRTERGRWRAHWTPQRATDARFFFAGKLCGGTIALKRARDGLPPGCLLSVGRTRYPHLSTKARILIFQNRRAIRLADPGEAQTASRRLSGVRILREVNVDNVVIW